MDAELANKVLMSYVRDYKRFKDLPAAVSTSQLLTLFDPAIQEEIKQELDKQQLEISTSADGNCPSILLFG